MTLKKRILVAPLNWGLGHATRCIPIIKALIDHNFEPIIASDGQALQLLKKEFPHVETVALPSYNIKYATEGKYLKLRLLISLPNIEKAIRAENKLVNTIIRDKNIHGIISDNRLGVHNKKAPSVYITHQLNVLSGKTSWMSTKMHHYFIKKFDECWVPDLAQEPNLSGVLGHLDKAIIKTKYLGVLSRFRKQNLELKYKLLVLLSGPEPQRTILDEQLQRQLCSFKEPVLFVRGKIEDEQTKVQKNNMTLVNFMLAEELETAMNKSKIVLARSGYTTILDLAKLGKKAFFIPTPGQFEQDYLAKYLEKKTIARFSNQEDFTIENIKKVADYKGFEEFNSSVNFEELFNLF